MKRWIPGAATLLALLVTWELTCRLGAVSPVLVQPPSAAWSAGVDLGRRGLLLADLQFTLSVYGTALITSLLVGTGLGVALGSSRELDAAVGPLVVGANALPKVVLLPLLGLWFGVGFASNVVLATLMGVFPVLVVVSTRVRELHAAWSPLARSFDAPRSLYVRRILLPGLVPALLAGARIAATYAMVGALLGELFAGSRGLGFRMTTAMANFRIDVFFATAAVAVAVSVTVTGLFAYAGTVVERRWSA